MQKAMIRKLTNPPTRTDRWISICCFSLCFLLLYCSVALHLLSLTRDDGLYPFKYYLRLSICTFYFGISFERYTSQFGDFF